jgi:outer membrane protein OmpA-like peptidoglycan-associated protein
MSTNLLSLAQQALGTDFSKLAGQFLGESQASTQSAMSSLLPAVMGMIAQKGSTQQGASALLQQLQSPAIDTNMLGNIAGLLGGGGSQMQSLLKLGTDTLVPALLGDKAGGLVNSLASAAGIKGSSATNLLAMVVPMIFAFLKKFIGEKKLDAGGLTALMGGQGEFLSSALDSRITSALGFGSTGAFLSGIGGAATDAAKRAGAAVASGAGAAASTAAAATVAGKSAFMRWLPWIIGLAVLWWLWSMFSGKPTPPAPTPAPVPKAAAPAAPAAAPAPAAVAGFPAKLYFDTGSATIGPIANATLISAAETIKKDGLKVALTGYTDKTGDVAKNEELAKARAMAVRDALKAAGVAEGSIALQPPVFVEIGAGGNDAEARRVEINKQ